MNRTELAPLYAGHLARLTERYAPLWRKHGMDALVIHSGAPKMRTRFDDQCFPHRVVPAFAHWVPVGAPRWAVVLRADGTRTLHAFRDANFWERPAPLEWPEFTDAWQLQEHRSDEALAQVLAGSARTVVLSEDPTFAALCGMPSANEALLRDLDATRVHKTSYEQHCLRVANERAAGGHAELGRLFDTMSQTEFDLHLSYLKHTRQDDQETPYKNIVAFGPNAAVLHHVSYARNSGDSATSMLVDAGATCLGYSSDISRTWTRGVGARVDAFAALHASMETMQLQLVSEARAGVLYEDLHDRCHALMGQLLTQHELVSCSAEEAVSSGLTRVFLPHGLGHSLGLQTHDVGCAIVKPKTENPFLRNTAPIEVGQCFTIEPGLYFIEPLLAQLRTTAAGSHVHWGTVAALACMGGIRIEDDLVVGDNGELVNLTRQAFAALV